jgi:hypothetical protein
VRLDCVDANCSKNLGATLKNGKRWTMLFSRSRP